MAKTAKQLAKDALAKQTARKIAKVKKRPTTPPPSPKKPSPKEPGLWRSKNGGEFTFSPSTVISPTKRIGSAYDAATPLPRKSGKAKKGYSINNVMCGHTRKK